MAIDHGMWRIGAAPMKLQPVKLENENLLEELITKDISILNDGWLLVGRQVRTGFDKFIDLLAVDADGSLIVIELKRHRTPRDVVAQAIDYASWIQGLTDSKVIEIHEAFRKQYGIGDQSLDQTFEKRFGIRLGDVELNSSHQIVVVAAELDASTERIINYLNDKAVPVNAVFFKVFQDQGHQYLSRAWMIDPGETQERAAVASAKEPWNNEYYVSFGDSHRRNWDDARQWGFISAGGGRWYSNTLGMLNEGDRIWVNIPKTGYVGVGIVTGPVVRADEFMVPVEGGMKPLPEVSTRAKYRSKPENENEDTAEYIVPVNWSHTVPAAKAFSETGLFGNQNSVCKPRAERWGHTVSRLKQAWSVG